MGIFLSFLLSGCSSGGSSPEDKQTQQKIFDRRIGEIQTLSNSVIASEGTHLLRMSDGKTILLHSSTVDLGDERFKDQTVEVSGTLTYTQGNTQIMDVDNVDILDIIGIEEEELKPITWKNHSNSLLGFSLQYRDDYEVQEEENSVSFIKKTENVSLSQEKESAETTLDENNQENATKTQQVSIKIEVISKPEGQSLLEFLGQPPQAPSAEDATPDSDPSIDVNQAQKEAPLPEGFSKSKIGEQNLDALKSEKYKMIEFYTEFGSKYYHLIFDGTKVEQDVNEEINTFYQLVNSFKLTSYSSNSSNSIEKEKSFVAQESSASPVTNELMATDNNDDQAEQSEQTETSEAIENYEVFESSGYKFSVQYPKSWYFEGTDYKDDQVSKRYTFGTKPLDEEPGTIHLDIVSTPPSQGHEIVFNGKTLIQVDKNGTTEFYYKNENGRIYRISGESTHKNILKNMAGSL